MKRIALFTICLTAGIAAALAQSSFVATLNHKGTYTNYYQRSALTEAYNAAEDGDIITLSEGTFDGPEVINKGVDIRGVGLGTDQRTYITNSFEVYSQDSTRTMNLEGLYLQNTLNIYADGSAKSAGTINIVKSRCNDVNILEKNSADSENTPKVRFYNCKIEGFYKSDSTPWTNIQIYNSHIAGDGYYTGISNVANTMFKNCYFKNNRRGDSNINLHYAYLENCIIRFDGSSTSGSYSNFFLPSDANARNCVGIDNSIRYSLFKNITRTENCSIYRYITNDLSDIFSDQNNYVLQESFAQAYRGTDGKEVGMYGGIGYTQKLRYPIVSSLNVNNENTTSRDGKLNITISILGE
jgi:hypothetical protein